MNNFLIWQEHDGKTQVFNLQSKSSVNLNFKNNESILYQGAANNEELDSFYAYFNDDNDQHYQTKFQIIEDNLSLIWKKKYTPLRFFKHKKENAIYITTVEKGELVKINTIDGKTVWRSKVNLTGRFNHILGANNNCIFLWTSTNEIIAINLLNGNLEWSIDKLPKPEGWADEAALRFSNIKILNENLMIGMKYRRLWNINLVNGNVAEPINYSNKFTSEGLYNQSTNYCFDGELITFFDEFERKLISFNWKTEKVESITSFPIQGKENLCGWQGPIIEGDNCFLLDTFGTLYIFGKTNNK
jgi:hypothetical protein